MHRSFLIAATLTLVATGLSGQDAKQPAPPKLDTSRGDQMIALPGWWYAITAASWLDLSENVPVTAESVRRYSGPILALRGSKEPPENYPAEKVAEACGARATLVVIPGADHFYNGTQPELVRAVCNWLVMIAG